MVLNTKGKIKFYMIANKELVAWTESWHNKNRCTKSNRGKNLSCLLILIKYVRMKTIQEETTQVKKSSLNKMCLPIFNEVVVGLWTNKKSDDQPYKFSLYNGAVIWIS